MKGHFSNNINRIKAVVLSIALITGNIIGIFPSNYINANAEKTVSDEQSLKEAADSEETIVLSEDVGIEEVLSFNDGKSHTLDLNGHNLYRSGERDKKSISEDGGVIILSNGSSLNITDNSTSDSGTIYGGVANKGGGILVKDGTLDIENINITNNFSKIGGAIYIKKGSAKLSNISFEQNGTTEEESTDDDVTVSTTYNIFSSLYKSVVSASEEEEE
ncbi:MAG: hypothetical protein K6D02_05160, partial [Lachnospiraceae bacterium]|nr:hypothetical protein [Lachnospiraceae bacterium]